MATRTRAAPSRGRRAPSRAKTAPSRAASGQQHVISVIAIIAILRQLLDPHGIYPVDLKKPIGDYIRGGAAARRAFFAVANRAFARLRAEPETRQPRQRQGPFRISSTSSPTGSGGTAIKSLKPKQGGTMTRSRSVAWATMVAIAGTLSTPLSVSAAPAAATAADACARQQGFYLRRNKLDISIYNASIDASAAEGAAISYTGDRENDTDTAEVHAVAAWVFARNPCSPVRRCRRSEGPMSLAMPSQLRFSVTGR